MDAKKHPTDEYIHPMANISTRSATSEAEEQKHPLSQKKYAEKFLS